MNKTAGIDKLQESYFWRQGRQPMAG